MTSKSASSITVLVKPRGKPIKTLPHELSLSPSANTNKLFQEISTKSGYSIHRLRITKGNDGGVVPNSSSVSLKSIGLQDQNVVYVKDLGPQIAWRTVFLIEYLGPIIIHALFYSFRPLFYSNPSRASAFPPPSTSQQLFFIMIVLHFMKRELETLFVHRFSLATMPAFNIFKNSAHYWLLAGLNIAYWTYSPTAPAAQLRSPQLILAAIIIYAIGELGNLSTHLTLRSLRSSGGTERNIPTTGLFSVVPVTCPNYFFETVAWIGMWLTNWSLSMGIFIVVAAGQMYVWAKKKERKYRDEFGDKYKKKSFVMIPGIM